MSEKKVNEQGQDSRSSQPATNSDAKPGAKRPYTAPQILSAEPLEAAAATCAPPAGGFGKAVPIPCGTLGS